MVVVIALTYATQDHEGRRDYRKRVIDFKRISLGWYAVVLFMVPTVTGLATLLGVLSGGGGAHLEAQFQSSPVSILRFAIFTLFFGPLPVPLQTRGAITLAGENSRKCSHQMDTACAQPGTETTHRSAARKRRPQAPSLGSLFCMSSPL